MAEKCVSVCSTPSMLSESFRLMLVLMPAILTTLLLSLSSLRLEQLESLAVDELLGALQQLGSLRALQRESYAGLWDFTRPDVTVTQIAAAAMTRSGSNSSQVRSIGIDAGSTLSAESSVGNSDHLEAVQVVVVRTLVAGQSYRVVLPGGRTTTELFPVGAKVGDTLTIHVPRLSENGPQDSSSSQALQLSAVEASTEMSGVDDGVVVLAPSQDTNGPENSESILVSSSSVNVEAAEDAAWVASRLKRPRWMPDDEVRFLLEAFAVYAF